MMWICHFKFKRARTLFNYLGSHVNFQDFLEESHVPAPCSEHISCIVPYDGIRPGLNLLFFRDINRSVQPRYDKYIILMQSSRCQCSKQNANNILHSCMFQTLHPSQHCLTGEIAIPHRGVDISEVLLNSPCCCCQLATWRLRSILDLNLEQEQENQRI
jgi:hypothetical protein